MPPEIALLSYKITGLLVGTAFAYMGYRLFLRGIWGDAGHLEASYDNNRLLLKGAAPGTFFALFGTVIISVVLIQGFQTLSIRSQGDNATPASRSLATLELPADVPSDLAAFRGKYERILQSLSNGDCGPALSEVQELHYVYSLRPETRDKAFWRTLENLNSYCSPAGVEAHYGCCR